MICLQIAALKEGTQWLCHVKKQWGFESIKVHFMESNFFITDKWKLAGHLDL